MGFLNPEDYNLVGMTISYKAVGSGTMSNDTGVLGSMG